MLLYSIAVGKENKAALKSQGTGKLGKDPENVAHFVAATAYYEKEQ